MNNKIFMGLIILGVIFVGSAAYALFNENILLDVTADVQANDASSSNNQPNIQNNRSNNIANGENPSSSFNNIANAILNDIGVVNDDSGQKVVKELRRITAKDGIHVRYDDSSYFIVTDNGTFMVRDILMPVYDTDSVSGGFIVCADCGYFIPVGDVSVLVPDDYLCKCPDEHPTSLKGLSQVYSEESVLEDIKLTEHSKHNVVIPEDNSFEDSFKNIDTVDNVSVSDESTQGNVENTDSFEDYWEKLWEEDCAKHRLMPTDNHPEIPKISFVM